MHETVDFSTISGQDCWVHTLRLQRLLRLIVPGYSRLSGSCNSTWTFPAHVYSTNEHCINAACAYLMYLI